MDELLNVLAVLGQIQYTNQPSYNPTMSFEAKDWIAVLALVISGLSLVFSSRASRFQREAKIAELRREALSSLQECRVANLGVMQIIRDITNAPKTPKTDDLLIRAVNAHKSCEECLQTGDQLVSLLRDASEKDLFEYLGKHMVETEAMAKGFAKMTDDLTTLSEQWLTKR